MEQNQSPTKESRLQTFITSVPLAILVGAAMVSGSILYVGSGGIPAANIQDAVQPTAKEDAPQVIKDPSVLFGKGDASIGSEKAKVTIVEFSDFQCPFCRSFFNDTYGQLKKEFIDTGKARLIFRHYPLPFHDAARPAALASECAAEQGKFWQFHDKMFIEQDKKGSATVAFGAVDLKAWASQIGLNAAQFNSCLDTSKYAKKIDDDTAAGSSFGVNGTPSFFINERLLVGAQPLEQFRKAINDAL